MRYTRGGLEDEFDGAQPDDILIFDERLLYFKLVDIELVLRRKFDDSPDAIIPGNLCMVARNRNVGCDNIVVRFTSNGDGRPGDLECAVRLRSGEKLDRT